METSTSPTLVSAELEEGDPTVIYDQDARLRVLQLLLEEASAMGVTISRIGDAITQNKMGPLFSRSFDSLVIGLGVPRDRVVDIVRLVVRGKEPWTSELALMATMFGPSIPTPEQAAEIHRYATNLRKRADRLSRAKGQALELLRSQGHVPEV